MIRTAGVLLAVVLVMMLAGDATACPNCSDAMPSASDGTEQGSVAEGFYYSILLMMAAPFVLAGAITTTIWYFARNGFGTIQPEA